MKLLLDMNMTPQFVEMLHEEGFDVVHWASVGVAWDADKTIMAYALAHGFVIVTRDLDFSAMLGASGEYLPSVVQIRARVSMPHEIGEQLVAALHRMARQLAEGAVVTVTPTKLRVRLLPLPGRD